MRKQASYPGYGFVDAVVLAVMCVVMAGALSIPSVPHVLSFVAVAALTARVRDGQIKRRRR